MSEAAAREIAQLMEEAREKDAEIERLKGRIEKLEKLNQMTDEQVVMDLKEEIDRLKGLLARMASKYEEEYGPFNPEHDSQCESYVLVLEAREATK